jgi:hypothetical protein
LSGWLCRPKLKIAPEGERPEVERCDWPHEIHDSHLLAMRKQLDSNYKKGNAGQNKKPKT